MKQIIILFSSILLGVYLVNLIIGTNGVGTTAKEIWKMEYENRSSVFQSADE